jgi:ornithine cyclodeaminase
MKIITLDQIKQILPTIDIIPQIEKGFQTYSEGKVAVPPIGEMLLDKGEVHIKYGFVKGEEYYVIKVASGFYDNPAMGLPSGNGLMLLYKQETGEPVSILLDQGYLTDVRTAVAGAIVAKYLAPSNVDKIGIVGTGIQARLQLLYLKNVMWSNAGRSWFMEGARRRWMPTNPKWKRRDSTLRPHRILRKFSNNAISLSQPHLPNLTY